MAFASFGALGFGSLPKASGARLNRSFENGSSFSVFQALYQTGDHLGDLLQVGFELLMDFRRDEVPPAGQFEKGNTFLYAASGDAEEVFSVRFREPAVAFGDVRGDGQRCPVQLVGQEVEAPWETACDFCNPISQIYGLLVDDEFFECEGHFRFPLRVESRKETAGEVKFNRRGGLMPLPWFLLYSLLSPLSCSSRKAGL